MNFSRIKKEDNIYRIKTFGCGCCSSEKHFPMDDWEEEEYYSLPTVEEVLNLKIELYNQLELANELLGKIKLCKE